MRRLLPAHYFPCQEKSCWILAAQVLGVPARRYRQGSLWKWVLSAENNPCANAEVKLGQAGNGIWCLGVLVTLREGTGGRD